MNQQDNPHSSHSSSGPDFSPELNPDIVSTPNAEHGAAAPQDPKVANGSLTPVEPIVPAESQKSKGAFQADEASAMWQNYQGKIGKKEKNHERSSNALYVVLGMLVFAIVAAGLWIVVFR